MDVRQDDNAMKLTTYIMGHGFRERENLIYRMENSLEDWGSVITFLEMGQPFINIGQSTPQIMQCCETWSFHHKIVLKSLLCSFKSCKEQK